MKTLTAARLREMLNYDKRSGLFSWKARTSNRIHIGDVAGCTDHWGYVEIRIGGRLYKAHRLAWLYVTGHWPEDQIDHKNNVRHDNRWTNLRAATNALNAQNVSLARKDSQIGLKGVRSDGRRFSARIHVDGSTRHIGMFDSPESAHAAYVKAKRALHEGGML